MERLKWNWWKIRKKKRERNYGLAYHSNLSNLWGVNVIFKNLKNLTFFKEYLRLLAISKKIFFFSNFCAISKDGLFWDFIISIAYEEKKMIKKKKLWTFPSQLWQEGTYIHCSLQVTKNVWKKRNKQTKKMTKGNKKMITFLFLFYISSLILYFLVCLMPV